MSVCLYVCMCVYMHHGLMPPGRGIILLLLPIANTPSVCSQRVAVLVEVCLYVCLSVCVYVCVYMHHRLMPPRRGIILLLLPIANTPSMCSQRVAGLVDTLQYPLTWTGDRETAVVCLYVCLSVCLYVCLYVCMCVCIQ